jgi:hypothetical protein
MENFLYPNETEIMNKLKFDNQFITIDILSKLNNDELSFSIRLIEDNVKEQ